MNINIDVNVQHGSADIIVNYSRDNVYVTYDKPIKNTTLNKFIYIFIRDKFSVTRITFVNLEKLTKLKEEFEKNQENLRYIDLSYTALLPNYFITRYMILIPEYIRAKIKNIQEVDYYERWLYTAIADIPNIIDNDKYRETDTYDIALRRTKLKIDQIKKIVIDKLKTFIELHKTDIYRQDKYAELYNQFIQNLDKYLFPITNNQDTETK